jgi:hypothetical protein
MNGSLPAKYRFERSSLEEVHCQAGLSAKKLMLQSLVAETKPTLKPLPLSY